MSTLRIRDRDMAVREEGVCVADSEPTQLYTVRFPYKEILFTIQLQPRIATRLLICWQFWLGFGFKELSGFLQK